MSVHPVIQQMLDRAGAEHRPPLSSLTVADARKMFSANRQALRSGPELVAVEDMAIAGPAGPIPCRLYVPREAPLGVGVYLHGGGWVLGALDDFDALVRTLAHRSGCVLLSVDYRLAPEHPFPAALEDAAAAIAWAATTGCARFSVGPGIVVAGDSAGANLAAVSSLHAAAQIRAQVLFNPCVDAAFDTASYREFGNDLLLTEADMRWFFAHYDPSGNWERPDIAPLRSTQLDNAPPTWIGVAEYDVLRDEGLAFASCLAAAGRLVTCRRYPGLIHGYARMFNLVDTADAAVSEAAEAIQKTFSRGG